MPKRKKPYDPAAQIRADTERREQEALRSHLERQGAELKLDAAGRIISARRSNVFNLLLIRGTITPNHHDAAYTLANDWAAWKGLEGKPETIGGGSGSRELVTDRMIQAHARINAAFFDLAQEHVNLLTAFMIATVEQDRPMAWRGIVERVTGETVRDKQPKVVVAALEALRCVYQEPRRAAA